MNDQPLVPHYKMMVSFGTLQRCTTKLFMGQQKHKENISVGDTKIEIAVYASTILMQD